MCWFESSLGHKASTLVEAFVFCNMITVYVIESLFDETWYTGIAIDATKRLKEHNSGKNRFTKGHMPWKIIYTEEQADWTSARIREKYLKSASGKIWLRKQLLRGGGARKGAGSLPDCVTQAGNPVPGTRP